MAEKKKMEMLIDYDFLERTRPFPAEHVGNLMRMLITYDRFGTEPSQNDALYWPFCMEKARIDKRKKEYENKCEKNRQIAQEYWDNKNAPPPEPPSAGQIEPSTPEPPPNEQQELPPPDKMPNNANAYNRIKNDAKRADTDIDIDVDKNIDNNTLVQTGQGESDFKPNDLISECWQEFYEQYPKHEKKKDAQAAYFKVFKGFKERDRIIKQAQVILTGLSTAAAYWKKENKEMRYIPLPSSWLNGERWTDEIKAGTNYKPPSASGQSDIPKLGVVI